MLNLNNESNLVFIDGLEVETLVGIYEHERKEKQIVNLKGKFFFTQSEKRDSIEATIDYDKIIDIIKETSLSAEFFLLETLAERIIKKLFLEIPPIHEINLSLAKKNLYPFAVGLEINRLRK